MTQPDFISAGMLRPRSSQTQPHQDGRVKAALATAHIAPHRLEKTVRYCTAVQKDCLTRSPDSLGQLAALVMTHDMMVQHLRMETVCQKKGKTHPKPQNPKDRKHKLEPAHLTASVSWPPSSWPST